MAPGPAGPVSPRPTPEPAPEQTVEPPPKSESAKDRVRRQITEQMGDEDPSTWPPLPTPYFRAYMKDEIAPLITECMCELYPDDEPQKIILEIRLIGAPGIGGTVDSVEPGEGKELEDSDGLMECIRESAFSADLPPPQERGATTITMGATGCNTKGQAAGG